MRCILNMQERLILEKKSTVLYIDTKLLQSHSISIHAKMCFMYSTTIHNKNSHKRKNQVWWRTPILKLQKSLYFIVILLPRLLMGQGLMFLSLLLPNQCLYISIRKLVVPFNYYYNVIILTPWFWPEKCFCLGRFSSIMALVFI